MLFAYRACQQQSTQELPFFLLYGCDPRLPTEDMLFPPSTRVHLNLQEYVVELAKQMAGAWESARSAITKPQKK